MIGKTFGPLARLERYRGHFFHWYDTRSPKPLLPRYVSTVNRVIVDGNEPSEKTVLMVDDRNDHHVEVEVGTSFNPARGA